MPSLAIIGTGIAGLGCAHFLQRDFDLTIFEQNDYVGGHTNTITTPEPGTARSVAMDTGFMVFNKVTYPCLTRLFDQLNVAIKPTAMSFSVRHAESGLEFAGSSLNHLFAQRRNLLRPRFWRMLSAINRFNAEAVAALADPAAAHETLGDYVRRRGYGTDFFNLYLVPMSSAVWSTPPEQMLAFPATTLLRFFHNHGFLGLNTQHPWWTVDGGAKSYVTKLTAPWRDRIRLGEAATRIVRTGDGVAVTTVTGQVHTFDKVILACHGDQARRLLAAPTFDEDRLLSTFRYQPNVATVHTDASVMPRRRLAWSSWNYEIARDAAGRTSTATHYWMNELQGVSDRENYFVTINRPEAIAPNRVLRRINYEHPLFSLPAVRAQAEIPALNAAAVGGTETYFAGAWQRYGFHEDGLLSAVKLSELILRRDPWPTTAPRATVLAHAG
ncbi:NAD(P)/FAD-dependent oxidoreductase [Horticoccus sp. 23ND18S-11]|uniref:NAD(P)/FAD-dependent oxidoreductase n=1 Tax=Horticoccus sp. 23ND18S-11 TaxID=3391832 RepID=UPI0039C91724